MTGGNGKPGICRCLAGDAGASLAAGSFKFCEPSTRRRHGVLHSLDRLFGLAQLPGMQAQVPSQFADFVIDGVPVPQHRRKRHLEHVGDRNGLVESDSPFVLLGPGNSAGVDASSDHVGDARSKRCLRETRPLPLLIESSGKRLCCYGHVEVLSCCIKSGDEHLIARNALRLSPYIAMLTVRQVATTPQSTHQFSWVAVTSDSRNDGRMGPTERS
jgi:hypothetical protein